jgi:hypothetical protein
MLRVFDIQIEDGTERRHDTHALAGAQDLPPGNYELVLRTTDGVPVLAAVNTARDQGPCTVCGVPWAKHGTAPTCASHDYTPAGTAGVMGTLETEAERLYRAAEPSGFPWQELTEYTRRMWIERAAGVGSSPAPSRPYACPYCDQREGWAHGEFCRGAGTMVKQPDGVAPSLNDQPKGGA